jgi:4'-phosphopantetheinyl transferase
MPLLSIRKPFGGASFGVWQITETEDFFRHDLPLSPDEADELSLHKGIRRLEWLASRWLLHQLTGMPQRIPLAKDAFSKPFFLEKPEFSCSLSHSQGVVAALLVASSVQRPKVQIGCDLQVLVSKMTRLAPKFINEAEFAYFQRRTAAHQYDMMHILWTAKEAMYKAYGLKALDFRRDMVVKEFSWDGHAAIAEGMVHKADVKLSFELYIEKNTLPDKDEPYIRTVCVTSGADTSSY